MNYPPLNAERIFVRVPWQLKDLALSLGGRWDAARRETGFPAGTDLKELFEAIEVYYEMHPRVRAPKQPRIQPGPDVSEIYIDFKARGREEAKAFIKSVGGGYHGDRADRGEKGWWLVPNEHVERVKGMVELPAINWGRS